MLYWLSATWDRRKVRREAGQKANRTMKNSSLPAGFHKLNPAARLVPVGAGGGTPEVIPPPSPEVEEMLLPFGAVAKAIFVKANGLAAYFKSIGSCRCTR